MSSAETAEPIVLRASQLVDVVTGEVQSPGVVVVEGDRISGVGSDAAPGGAQVVELGDRTLLPGLMDMELNFFMGGPGDRGARTSVTETPIDRSFRAVVNAKTTLLAGFTTVRNLGLFIPTGGHLLDVSLSRAIDRGYVVGPRIVAAGHAITPTGGHLEPTMFFGIAHGMMPLSVEEGVADGVTEVRKAVRHQIKHGAGVIKVCASGGVMSHTGPAGAQQFSDEELAVVADEAHRAGLRVAAHTHGDAGIRAAINAGIDCIEHGSLMTEDTLQLAKDSGTFLVATTYLADGMDVSRAAPELQAKAAEVFPRARQTITRALEMDLKVCCGTDAPAIPHGQNAKELIALVNRGASPLRALQTATIAAADLIDVDDRARLEPGLLADVVAVPGDPLEDIAATEGIDFVMQGGQIHRTPG